MEKPTYRSSRWYLWGSFIGAWSVIIVLALGAIFGSEQAVAFGSIALPTMFAIITGNPAVHRGFGSADFRAQNHDNTPSPPRSAYHARDEPNATSRDAN